MVKPSLVIINPWQTKKLVFPCRHTLVCLLFLLGWFLQSGFSLLAFI